MRVRGRAGLGAGREILCKTKTEREKKYEKNGEGERAHATTTTTTVKKINVISLIKNSFTGLEKGRKKTLQRGVGWRRGGRRKGESGFV